MESVRALVLTVDELDTMYDVLRAYRTLDEDEYKKVIKLMDDLGDHINELGCISC